MIRHFFLIRFNMNTTDEGWLKQRISLFERFTLSSLHDQTNKNYRVILFCDERTTESWKRVIESYRFDIEWTHRKWFDSESVVVNEAVSKRITNSEDIIITTRLDNDDAICRSFVDRTQKAAKVNHVISFPLGYLYKNGKIYLHDFTGNHFLSYVSSSNDIKTIFCGNHMRLPSRYPCISIRDAVGWMEVIHDKNLKNTLARRDLHDDSPTIDLEEVRKEFRFI